MSCKILLTGLWFVILTPSISSILQFAEAELSKEPVTQSRKGETTN